MKVALHVDIATELDYLALLARRARRARRDGFVLLAAVVAGNVAYLVASSMRGPSTLAWSGIFVATALAHVVAWRSRQLARRIDQEIRARISALR